MAKRTVGRTQIEVIDSIPYSQLIFLIASGKNYALTIAEARGKKDSSPTVKQLKQLETRGFLKSQKEKLLNKTVYSINWIRINEEFINFMRLKSQQPTFKIPDKCKNNKFLSLYFEGIFSLHHKIKTRTIKDIFERVSIACLDGFAPPLKNDKPRELKEFFKFLELINTSNWESRTFIEKSEEILNKFSRNTKSFIMKNR